MHQLVAQEGVRNIEMNPEFDLSQAEQSARMAFNGRLSFALEFNQWIRIDPDARSQALFQEKKDLAFNDHETVARLMGLNPGDLVLDVGAYIGDSAVAFIRCGCDVIAFEPFLDAFICLQYNLRPHRSSSSCYNVAIGDGSSVTYNHKYQDSDCGCRYLDVCEDAGFQTIGLDDILLRPEHRKVRAIKVDVEGFELNVIRGADGIIKRDRPIMHVESFPDALLRQGVKTESLHSHIRSLGYNLMIPLEPHSADPKWVDVSAVNVNTVQELFCFPI